MTELEYCREIATACKRTLIGKTLPNAFYVHLQALTAVDAWLQQQEQRARKIVEDVGEATIVKFHLQQPKISYLYYPDFDSLPHPPLLGSLIVDLVSGEVSDRRYNPNDNPPVLHRKETFVTPDYPHYQHWQQLTRWEECLGLLDNSRLIGTYQEWQQVLQQQGIGFAGHNLICSLNAKPEVYKIERHRAAIVRNSLSRPVRLALDADLFSPGSSFFDYGCGYGGDIAKIAAEGYESTGWDPYYQPHSRRQPADVVNLGYVINVIEDSLERREALWEAWSLTRRVLIVSAQVLIDDRRRGLVAYGDGMITSRNTFQKYYQQGELKNYIESVLQTEAIALGLGVFVVFRDPAEAESFRACQYYSRLSTPRVRAQVRKFEDYQTMLAPLIEFVTTRGRLPVKGEWSQGEEIRAEFGSYHRAFKLILQATDPTQWEEITQRRRQDLLVYLALEKFGDRMSARKLSPQAKADFKSLFSSYKQACSLADQMLFSLGNLGQIAFWCRANPVGKLGKKSLAIHTSVLSQLHPLLRLYEGCASKTFGRLESANVIKLYWHRPQIAYLVYPEFDTVAHPLLQTSMVVDLHSFDVSYHDYSLEDNPPVLHQKDTLVSTEYPLYDKFSRLTQQEYKWGLFEDESAIARLQGWNQCLESHCATIQHHRLYWRKDADPYRVKILRNQMARRRCQQS